MLRMFRVALLAIVSMGGAVGRASEPPSSDEAAWPAEATEFFERDVRPLLAARCYSCHASSIETPEAGLRLDGRASILAGGASGPAAVPGEPDASLIVEAITGDAGLEMPPDEPLSTAERDVLRRWIEIGMPWPAETSEADRFDLARRAETHWAWQPVRRAAAPRVDATAWPDGPIDAFVLAELERAELAPASDARRHEIIRRLSFTLLGLPPAPEDVQRFLADRRPDALHRLVDRMLADPRLGVRWGRHWLDVVRYAETYGHEFDYPIPEAWKYRDWVIEAINHDLPYDRFITEQLAGDLLDAPRRDPVDGTNRSAVGTGFWWLGEAVHAPVDIGADRAAREENQIDVAGKAVLGMTIACARCHDHKFDAISQADYYAMAGLMHSMQRSHGWLDPQGRIERASRRVARARDELTEAVIALLPKPAEADAGVARAARAASSERTERSAADVLFDLTAGWPEGARSEGWAFRPAGAETVQVAVAPEKPSDEPADDEPADDGAGAPRLVATPGGWLDSRRAGAGAAGVWRSPPFVIDRPALALRVAGRGAEVRLVIDGYFMDQYQPLLFKGCRHEVESGGRWQWLVHAGDLRHYVGRTAHLEVVDPGDGWVAMAEARWRDSAAPPAEPADPFAAFADDAAARDALPAAVEYADGEIRVRGAVGIGPAAAAVLESARRNAVGEDREALITATRRLARAGGEIPAAERALVAAELAPRDAPLLVRGDPAQPSEAVPRGDLTALGLSGVGGPARSIDRRELARRWTAPENPLTARVWTNRLWHHLLGRGLVASCDNFGVLGGTPSHPGLLDHLAAELVGADWSTKRVIREIATSRSYRLSSRREAAEADPRDALMHRGRVRRLEAEAVRDAVLAVAGRLDETLGGAPVAVHLTPFMTGRGRPASSGPVDGRGRRSVFLEVRRNFLSPLLVTFDMPLPYSTVGRRNRSNVPAQALSMWNDPFVHAMAEQWAGRVRAGTASPDEQIERMYWQAFARPPDAAERRAARAFLDAAAEEPGDGDPLKDLAHVLLNAKEFIYLP